MAFIDFNDETIPIGKRKVAYVKYAMRNGTSEIAARRQANKKFGFEVKDNYLLIIIVAGSFSWSRYDVVTHIKDNDGINHMKYSNIRHIEISVEEFEELGREGLKKKYSAKGEDVGYALFADGW